MLNYQRVTETTRKMQRNSPHILWIGMCVNIYIKDYQSFRCVVFVDVFWAVFAEAACEDAEKDHSAAPDIGFGTKKAILS